MVVNTPPKIAPARADYCDLFYNVLCLYHFYRNSFYFYNIFYKKIFIVLFCAISITLAILVIVNILHYHFLVDFLFAKICD